MTITILGTGCSTCQALEANTEQALERVALDVSVEKIEKIMQARLLVTFFGAVAVSIVGLGYFFNWVL